MRLRNRVVSQDAEEKASEQVTKPAPKSVEKKKRATKKAEKVAAELDEHVVAAVDNEAEAEDEAATEVEHKDNDKTEEAVNSKQNLGTAEPEKEDSEKDDNDDDDDDVVMDAEEEKREKIVLAQENKSSKSKKKLTEMKQPIKSNPDESPGIVEEAPEHGDNDTADEDVMEAEEEGAQEVVKPKEKEVAKTKRQTPKVDKPSSKKQPTVNKPSSKKRPMESDSDEAIEESDFDEDASLPDDEDIVDSDDIEMIAETSNGTHKKTTSISKQSTGGEQMRVKEFRGHRLPLTCVCLDAQDKFVYTASKDGSLIKWCLSSGKLLKRVKSITKKEAQTSKKLEERCHVRHINAIAISDDSKFLATGGWDKRVHIWSPEELTWVHTFTLHRQEITALAFRRGHHMLYSGSADRSVMIWNLEEDDNRCFVESLIGHESPVTSMDTTRKERVLTSGGRDQSIRIWKIVEQAQTVFQSKHHSADVTKFINDQLFVSGGEDGNLTVWTTMKRSPLCSVKAHDTDKKSNLSCWIVSLATYYLKQVKQPTKNKSKLLPHTTTNSAKRRKADEGTPVVGQEDDENEEDEDSDGEARAASDEENTNQTNTEASEGPLALIASGSCDSKVHIWKLVKNNLELHQTIECPGYVNDLKFTSDGSRLVAACGREHRFGRWTITKGVQNRWRVFDVNKL